MQKDFECPNLIKISGRWVIISGYNHKVAYWICDFDGVNFTPIINTSTLLDYGSNCYATTVFEKLP